MKIDEQWWWDMMDDIHSTCTDTISCVLFLQIDEMLRGRLDVRLRLVRFGVAFGISTMDIHSGKIEPSESI